MIHTCFHNRPLIYISPFDILKTLEWVVHNLFQVIYDTGTGNVSSFVTKEVKILPEIFS